MARASRRVGRVSGVRTEPPRRARRRSSPPASGHARARGSRRSRRRAPAESDRDRGRRARGSVRSRTSAIAARIRSARSGTSGGSIMRPWSWNGWRGWCRRCTSEANVSMAVAVARRAATTGSADPAGTLDVVAPLTVSVWTVDLDQPFAVVDVLRGFLDDAEVRAAAARRDDTVRNRYVVAHGATRSILGARLGVAPDTIEISRRCERCGDPAHGKPEVTGPEPSPRRASPSACRTRRRSRSSRSSPAHASASTSRSNARVPGSTRSRRGSSDAEAYADWLDVASRGPAARLPRAMDREGGLPEGDRRRHHACRCATCRSSPTVGP